MQRLHVWMAAAAGLVVTVLLAWLVLAPGWAVGAVQRAMAEELGREFGAKNARLEFTPRLAVRFDGISLSNPSDPDTPFLTAASLRLPLSLGQLLTHEVTLETVELDSPDIAFAINDRGEASWDVPGNSLLSLVIRNGTLRYFDARNGQSYAMGGADLTANLSSTGEMQVSGTAEVKGRLARIAAYIKSLPRAHHDGTPFELTFEVPEFSVTFSGQLSTAKVLSLSGRLSLDSDDLLAAARWTGIPIAAAGFGSGHLSGGLQAAGRALALHQAEATLGQWRGTGDLALDLRGELPKLQANLRMPALDLATVLPATGARPGEWGTAPLGLAALKAVDAEAVIDIKALSFDALAAGPSRLSLHLAAGQLDAVVDASAVAGGRARLNLAIDGAAMPPGLALGFVSENTDAAALLQPVAGISWLAGTGAIRASLSGSGNTQQEIVGSLNGSAELNLASGAISGIDATAGLATLSASMLDGWPGGDTAFAALSARFTIADGIAALSALNLDGPQMSLGARGDIDLLRRALELRADPKLKPDGSGLPVAVVVAGPWAAPRIYPDLPEFPANPAAGFAKLKTTAKPAAGN